MQINLRFTPEKTSKLKDLIKIDRVRLKTAKRAKARKERTQEKKVNFVKIYLGQLCLGKIVKWKNMDEIEEHA